MAKVTWSRWFRPFARVYEPFSRRAGQIHLSMNPDWYIMHSDIIGVDSDKDGRKMSVRGSEQMKSRKPFYCAVFSVQGKGEGYMNISPLPYK